MNSPPTSTPQKRHLSTSHDLLTKALEVLVNESSLRAAAVVSVNVQNCDILTALPGRATLIDIVSNQSELIRTATEAQQFINSAPIMYGSRACPLTIARLDSHHWLLAIHKGSLLFGHSQIELKFLDRLRSTLLNYKNALLIQDNALLKADNDLLKADRNYEKELLQSALAALLDGPPTDNPFQLTLQVLLKLFGCSIGTIWEYHDNTKYSDPSFLTLESAEGHEMRQYPQSCLREGEGLVSKSLECGAEKYLQLSQVLESDIANASVYQEYKDKHCLLIRLEAGSGIVGVACLAGEQRFSVEALTQPLELFEQLAILEIQNKRLKMKVQALEQMATIIPEAQEDQVDFCQKVVDVIRELVNAQAASIFLKPDLDPTRTKLELRAASVAPGNLKSEQLAEFERNGTPIRYIINANSLTGSVASTGESILSNVVSRDSRNSNRFREIVASDNDTWIGVPIKSELNICVGVIRCSGKLRTKDSENSSYIFNSYDAFTLQQFAAMIAPIFRTLRTLSELNKLTTQLKTAERIREHELKAPLGAIVANASFTRKYLDDQSVTSKARRLAEIVSDAETCAFLMKEARIPDQSEFDSALQYISPREMVQTLVDYLKREIQKRSQLRAASRAGSTSPDVQSPDIALDYEIPEFMKVSFRGSCPKLMLHRHLIQRAFFNLGINAVKYGVPSGNLEIVLHESRNNGYIEFIDNGIGIDAEDEQRIFEFGERGRNAQDGYSGEGIGLSVSKEIIEAHGGSITLLSSRNPTHFSVSLPIRRPPVTKRNTHSHPAIIRLDLEHGSQDKEIN